ncbi:MAG: hypothetical protein JXA37_14250 [Chloroflexia bacterium]|nr:hypothetical protein [Chloroflexia bacterium]
MDDIQLRFLTTQALYGKDLPERSLALRQLGQEQLTPANAKAISVRLELALGCADEYVRSAAAMLIEVLAQKLMVTPILVQELLSLSTSSQPFAREAALRAIKTICQEGRCQNQVDRQSLDERLEQARRSESEDFAMSLFDE